MPELTGIFSNNPHLIDVFTSKHDTIIKNNTIAISSQDEGVGTYFSGIYNEGFWLAIGVGIKKESGHFKIMEKADWELAYKTGVIPENGHFIFIKYDNRKLEIANDPFGIRDLFYTWENDTILFSTKIESLVDYKEDAKINFNAISTDFLFSERFTYDSELKGISRLGPDARAVFYPDKLTLKRNDTFLNPLNENKNIDDYFNNILSISTSKPLSLGLSGGVDSRILLAYMLANGVNFTTHSFGSREDPDNIAAKEMANSLKFENKVFDEYDRYKIIDYLREFLNYNPFNRGIERVPYYYFYKKQGENNTIIDGAFGEFARRDY
ncbi:MAG: hypothetical protein GWP03_06630 [Proteobacteria bacterium]|nr:hypothetical protein [Pseudomonadota bacterium]